MLRNRSRVRLHERSRSTGDARIRSGRRHPGLRRRCEPVNEARAGHIGRPAQSLQRTRRSSVARTCWNPIERGIRQRLEIAESARCFYACESLAQRPQRIEIPRSTIATLAHAALAEVERNTAQRPPTLPRKIGITPLQCFHQRTHFANQLEHNGIDTKHTNLRAPHDRGPPAPRTLDIGSISWTRGNFERFRQVLERWDRRRHGRATNSGTTQLGRAAYGAPGCNGQGGGQASGGTRLARIQARSRSTGRLRFSRERACRRRGDSGRCGRGDVAAMPRNIRMSLSRSTARVSISPT